MVQYIGTLWISLFIVVTEGIIFNQLLKPFWFWLVKVKDCWKIWIGCIYVLPYEININWFMIIEYGIICKALIFIKLCWFCRIIRIVVVFFYWYLSLVGENQFSIVQGFWTVWQGIFALVMVWVGGKYR